jgi:hypothetical protein
VTEDEPGARPRTIGGDWTVTEDEPGARPRTLGGDWTVTQDEPGARPRTIGGDWTVTQDEPGAPPRTIGGDRTVTQDEPGAPRRTIVIGGDVDGGLVVDSPAEDETAPPRAIVIDAPAQDAAVSAERADAPRARRTIVIGGHPDKLPPPRPRRPPRTALERVGASPDRLAGYAVALGLLLILIAVLTTSH